MSSSDTAFKQQRLKACQPILTPIPVIITFLVIGIIFVPVGVVMLISSNNVRCVAAPSPPCGCASRTFGTDFSCTQVVEVETRYDDNCQIGEICTVTLDIKEKMEEPVYLYYKLTNYYQNHRRYVKSRNDQQLRGNKVTSKSDIEVPRHLHHIPGLCCSCDVVTQLLGAWCALWCG